MQLHDIKPLTKVKRAKRLGRGAGSGHGKTSTRGHKGAKARAGRLFYMGFEGGNLPFFRKIPKRGFNHKKRVAYQIVNIQDLNSGFKKEDKVTPDLLFSRNLIKKRGGFVKILGKGTINKPIQISAHKFSKSALTKIKKAGGETEYLKVV